MKTKIEEVVDNMLGKKDIKDIKDKEGSKNSGEVSEFSKALSDNWMKISGAIESIRFEKGKELTKELKAVRDALEGLVKPIEDLQDKLK